jgi:glyoxalase family protein
MYHLFYGDNEGNPGISLTFFPEMTDQEGEPGERMLTELGLRIPEKSVAYYTERLEEKGFEIEEWYGKDTIAFEDLHSLPLRVVPEESDAYTP